jgi:hypothetical protein
MPGIDALLSVFDETESRGRYKKAIYVFMGFLLVYVVVRGVVGAEAKALWLDELMTLTTASQPTAHGVWTVMSRGFDIQPPAFYFLERVMLKLVANTALALRLPSILAFACIVICTFVFAKKRNGELIACLCAVVLLCTSLFHTYLTEARPYNLALACIAFALVCYQRLPSLPWTAMLAASLALAESFHYYGVFAMIPFGLAEMVFTFKARRIRWLVWVALACGAVPLVFTWPLLSAARRYYGTRLFARPDLAAVRGYYSAFFVLKDNSVGFSIAIAAAAGIVYLYFWRKNKIRERTNVNETDLAEGTLLLALTALPFVVLPLTLLMHGALLNRYVLAAILGLILGAGCTLSFAGPKAAATFALFVFSVASVRETTFWRHPTYDSFLVPFYALTSKRDILNLEEFIQSAGHPELPVVISDLVLYSQFMYYSSPDFKNRLVYLADERRELLYTRTDASSKTLSAFTEFFPPRTQDYSEFTATHPEFLLYSAGLDWYLPTFLHENYDIQLLAGSMGQVFLIKGKAASSPEERAAH